jgi:hypothetical protein
MYATTRYNFVRLKATHKISPLEELVGGRSVETQKWNIKSLQSRHGQIFGPGEQKHTPYKLT